MVRALLKIVPCHESPAEGSHSYLTFIFPNRAPYPFLAQRTSQSPVYPSCAVSGTRFSRVSSSLWMVSIFLHTCVALCVWIRRPTTVLGVSCSCVVVVLYDSRAWVLIFVCPEATEADVFDAFLGPE